MHRQEVRPAADQSDHDQDDDELLQAGAEEQPEGQAHTHVEARRRPAGEADPTKKRTAIIKPSSN